MESSDKLNPFTFSVISTQTISGLLSTKTGESVTVNWGDGTSNTYRGQDCVYSKDHGSVGNRVVVFTSGSDKLTKFTMTRTGANISLLTCRSCRGIDLFQLPRFQQGNGQLIITSYWLDLFQLRRPLTR